MMSHFFPALVVYVALLAGAGAVITGEIAAVDILFPPAIELVEVQP